MWTSYAITHSGKVRAVNEDAYLDRPDIGLWVVADGMGGHRAGAVASEAIITELNRIEQVETLTSFVEEVEVLLQQVNKQLMAMSVAQSETTGSTVAVFLAHDRFGAYVWAGDSRVYQMREGQLRRLTTDHSQVEVFVRLGLIDRSESANHPLSNIVTRAVGTHEVLNLDVDLIELQHGDRYLLCSDGLYRHVSDEEIKRFLALAPPVNVARALVDLTLARGAEDNVTVLVVEIDDPDRLAKPDPDVTFPNLPFEFTRS